ncbi:MULTISPECIES: hypothetical protein [Nocardiaceae]|uniref:hypothetical protein n=1 Tax=Nocardiaceae TaxID=85025 RepID=UPI000A3E5C9A|nr:MULTISPECIES: hypothetical protein [Rhodococcus]
MNTDQRRAALVTEVTGQDCGYLWELLLEHGAAIHGHAQDVLRQQPAKHFDQMIVTTV